MSRVYLYSHSVSVITCYGVTFTLHQECKQPSPQVTNTGAQTNSRQLHAHMQSKLLEKLYFLNKINLVKLFAFIMF